MVSGRANKRRSGEVDGSRQVNAAVPVPHTTQSCSWTEREWFDRVPGTGGDGGGSRQGTMVGRRRRSIDNIDGTLKNDRGKVSRR